MVLEIPTSTGGAIVGGDYRIEVAMYRSDAKNIWLEDISDIIEGGQISIDATQEASKMAFTGTLLERGRLSYYRDWIAPVMTIRTPDPEGLGTIRQTEQLGLYMYLPPTFDADQRNVIENIDARGPIWKMATSGPGYAYAIATGQNVGIRMENVCDLAKVRHAIQTTSETQPKRRTWPWNATWLQIFNDLAKSIGFVPAFEDRVGRVRTHRFRKLHQVPPARTIRSAFGDVYETIRITPDYSKICNHVVVVGNDPKKNDAEIFHKIKNNDPDSPTSTIALGTPNDDGSITETVISVFEEDPNLEKAQAVIDRAEYIMDHGSSTIFKMDVVTVPFIDWTIGDTMKCEIYTDEGEEVAVGTWRWDRLEMNMSRDATCRWTLSKVINWREIA
jgi:hypothetical protein